MRDDHSPVVSVVDHSLVAAALSTMRDRSTASTAFRAAVRSATWGLAFEATRFLPTELYDVDTPVATTTGRRLACRVVAAPVLRAGLGMLEAFLDIVPDAETGFIGLRRDEETLLPVEYYRNLPETSGAHVFLLDPMLATGGSAMAAIAATAPQSVASLTLISIIAAPEGIERLSAVPGLRIVTAAIDERLNDVGYIVPGLGDAGDRLWGTL